MKLIVNSLKEKYPYFLLGAAVILLVYLVLAGILAKNKVVRNETTNTKSANTTETNLIKENKYIVKAGDNLWKIAESTYGSGFNAYDIASANKISNPSLIEPGQALILPSIAPKAATVGEIAAAATTKPVTFIGDKYTIKHGDYLWKIAEEAYGDGYAWVRIAKANSLANPSLIHAGNVLIIPR